MSTGGNNRVLFVDDDLDILAAYKLRLGRRFDIVTAPSGRLGLRVLEEAPVALVISDQCMVGMDGIQFLSEVRKLSPDTVTMMLTGVSDVSTAVKAVTEGKVFQFFTKPCPPRELAGAIEAGLKQYNLIRAERHVMEQTLASFVGVLTDVLCLVSPEAFNKTQLLRGWARKVVRRLDPLKEWELDIAAMLSPIGLITMPPEIFGKVRQGAKLTKEEREIYERAPEAARNLISGIPRMKDLSDIIYYQNKGFDGSGFPDNHVAGKQIPLGGRLLKVLIDLAAIAGDPDRAAFAEMEERGHLYDPDVLRVVRSVIIHEQTPKDRAPTQKVVAVRAAGLRAGARVASNIETSEGTLLLAAGCEISQAQIERLCNLQNYRKLSEPLHVIEPRELSENSAGDEIASEPPLVTI